MTLREADARLKDCVLTFTCPNCKGLNQHRIRVTLDPVQDRFGQAYKHSGVFPDTLTLDPSINVGCWHGHVTNGEVLEG